MVDSMSTENLVIQELQNRIGLIVASYELQQAELKAEATQAINERDAKIAELERKFDEQ